MNLTLFILQGTRDICISAKAVHEFARVFRNKLRHEDTARRIQYRTTRWRFSVTRAVTIALFPVATVVLTFIPATADPTGYCHPSVT